MMGVFDKLGQKPQQLNPMQMLQQLRSNPMGMLKQAGYNIPDGMSNPQQMVNYLIQSGQVPQSRYQQVVQALNRTGRR